ncbi:protein SOB FIVE-LIKE 5-like isoform X2 [Impatiens glandulifera]|uniref:protein SOB FIVE-LIKE 5-like isoform X2 n=1 Tax=Impatiens glandulifera TaxID=253017 RepID=UPI001FB05672|nr:protein SOB FIVE-LIKE 5-like isoform X2 [Impatiens glandulifera]
MNNGMWDSECSSGCESGWTVYLEQSFMSSPYPSNRGMKKVKQFQEEDEEEDEEIIVAEDMSMVSDASSGPPHFQEHQEEAEEEPVNKRQKSKEKFRRTPDVHPSFLDDTASSPLFDFPQDAVKKKKKNTVEFSQGYSATHFDQERSAYHEQLGFIQYLPNGNQMQQNQWYGTGNMMGMR